MYRSRCLILVMFLNFSSASNSELWTEAPYHVLTLKNRLSLGMCFITNSHLTCENYCKSIFFPWILEIKYLSVNLFAHTPDSSIKSISSNYAKVLNSV